MKIGILGGTFDPIHKGHINIAEKILNRFGLDKIIFLPNGNPPHKDKVIASQEERFNLLKLAVKGHNRFEISTVELFNGRRSYTYETLAELQNQYPSDRLFFICGADNITQLDSWRHPELIFRQAAVIFINRPGYELDASALERLERKYNADILTCTDNDVGISSSMIKEILKNGGSAEEFIPENAVEYFKTVYCNV